MEEVKRWCNTCFYIDFNHLFIFLYDSAFTLLLIKYKEKQFNEILVPTGTQPVPILQVFTYF